MAGAYDANKAAYDLLIQNGFGLADGKGNRAENWEKNVLPDSK